MADSVQRIMDLMVTELDELVFMNVFTKDEVHAIVKRRRDFEYMLHRRTKLKQDFLNAIMYEMHLDALRKKRKARLGLKKTFEFDHSAKKRIHFLFHRACRFFKGDVAMWLQYLQYNMKTKNSRKMGTIFPEALQIHPRHAGLWIMAAGWEFDQNSNPAAARVLLQRAIRINKHEKKLWIEYFRLEMLYVAKLQGRRKVLGLPAPKPRGSALDVPLLETEKSLPTDEAGSEEEVELDTDTAKKAVLDGVVPRIVCNKALATFPDDLSMRTSLLNICDRFGEPFSSSIAAVILDEMKLSMSAEPSMWDTLARRQALKPAKTFAERQARRQSILVKALSTYREALSVLPSSEMYELAVRYYEDVINVAASDGDEQVVLDFATLVLEEVQRSQRDGLENAELRYKHVAILLRLCREGEAVAVADSGVEIFPGSCSLALQRIHLHRRLGAEASDITAMYKQALKVVAGGDAVAVWMDWLSYLIGSSEASETVLGQFHSALRSQVNRADIICDAALQWAACSCDLSVLRKVVDGILALPLSCLAKTPELYMRVLDLELGVEEIDAKRVRHLFEAAISDCGASDPTLWVGYVRFERCNGTHQKANSVVWRAKKAITDVVLLGALDTQLAALS